MNQLAIDLNSIIESANPHVLEMLSDIGRNLFFPKGILTQSAEAKQKADKINATIGIAKQNNHVMSLPSVASFVKGIEPDHYLTYAPSFGIPALREVWKRSLFQKNSSLEGKKVSLPVVTCGITHGISTFADLWINAGDTIILPDMMWGNYNMTFGVLNGARIVHYNAYTQDLGKMDIDAFERLIRQEAEKNGKIITVFNFPHNPTGYTVSVEEGRRMASILIDVAKNGTNVVAACDDAYFGLFFEEETMKESMFSLLAGADKRLMAVKLDGATKEDYVWGLRIGFLTYGVAAASGSVDASGAVDASGSAALGRTAASGITDSENSNLEELYLALEKKTAGCIRGSVSNVSHLSQSIVLKSMEDENYSLYKQEKFDLLKAREEEIKKVLKDPAYKDEFEPYPFNSGYFMCIRLKDLDVDAEKLRIHMLDQYGVGLISIGSRNLRVAFSCLEKEQVKTLFDMVLQGINDLKRNAHDHS